jgi:acyl transferase domain-containing protein
MTPTAVLLFPGLDAYAAGALRQAREEFPAIGDVMGEIDEASAAHGLPRLSDALFDGPPLSLDDLASQSAVLAELAVFAISLATARVLIGQGLRPVLMGHSFGEIAALTAAGALTPADGVALILARLTAFGAITGAGRMSVVMADEATVSALITGQDGTDVSVACVNAPTQCVISGSVESIGNVAAAFRDLGIACIPLGLPYAAHYPGARAASQIFLELIASVRQAPLQYPVFSPVRSRWYHDEDDLPQALAECMERPVYFSSAVGALHEAGVRVFIEAGARRGLTHCAQETLAGAPGAKFFAPLLDPAAESASLRMTVAEMAAAAENRSS